MHDTYELDCPMNKNANSENQRVRRAFEDGISAQKEVQKMTDLIFNMK